MKEIKRKKTIGFIYMVFLIYLIILIIREPSEYSILVKLLTIYGYKGFAIVMAIISLIYIIFTFSKPFGKVWPDRLLIYKSPFRTYDLKIKDLRSYSEYQNKIEVKDRFGNSYKINTKMIGDSSKIDVLKSFLRNGIERNNN